MPLPSAHAVAAGQTATFDLPTDRRYHKLDIVYGTSTAGGANQTNMEAEITEARVKINGRVQRVFSAAQLFDINALNGQSFNTGHLPIYLSEPWRRDPAGEDALAWGMANVDTFQIEVDIDSGATSPTLGGIAVIDNVQQPLRGIIKWRRQVVPVSATGIVTVSTLAKNAGSYARLHAFEAAAGDISDVDIEVDQLTVYDLTDDQNTEALDDQGLSPQADVFHIIFDDTQRVQDALSMAKANGQPVAELRLDFNMAAASSFTLLSEILGNPD
ncbi:MAG: hypothetical protein GWO39_07655 [Gammaproteobacteria bacterium]|nr:hypothetical protein [Gammaproteobacteria bacterium]NIY32234.1 hypothetical protein [Gammaproteobacteria bacterium]